MMFGSGSGLSFLLVPMVIGAVMTGLRFWMFYSGTSAIRSARMGRINDSDAHLSFDERVAERMRELERDKDSAAAPATPFTPPPPPTLTSGLTGATQGFGRRQI